MPIFTAAATAALAGTALAGTFAVTALATGFSLAASVGLSYAVAAVSGQNNQQSTDSFGVQGKLTGGGDVPRSFGLGYHSTAGSLVYANFHGTGYDTPNAIQTWVIAVSDLPENLVGLWVNGAKVTLPDGAAHYSLWTDDDDLGYAIPEYIRPHNGEGADTPHLWVKYYDGTQTEADRYLVSAMAATERPYENTRVGKGISFLVLHAFNDENLWTGFPTFKAELSGIKLYDPSKDSTVGGSGTHRFADPATWGGDGDQFPAVQSYAILRGISYNGVWLYGLQNMVAARLPLANWITQIEKCRVTVEGDSGPEPSYRTGCQVDVDAQPVNLLETLMTGCQGKISEIGGFYKCRLGAPDSPTFSFTDGDLVSTEPQTFRPFFALSDSVNGIQAKYPDPSQGWNNATAPAYYRTDLEIKDGNRRLMASPQFDAVPYPEQAQRLQKSAIEEAQRARGHTVVLPPAYWTVEPGDVGEWTSARNGYSAKQFRVDAGTDKANLDIALTLTEVDPADYDWDRDSDLKPVETGATVSNPPAAQGVTNWNAQPYTLLDDSGIARRPAILISWDGSQPGISGVRFEVRLASDGSSVTRGTTNSVSAGNLIITESILPAMTYQVRGQYVPSTPRDMLWSAWLTVATPDIRLSLAEFEAAVKAQVTTIFAQLSDKVDAIEQDFAARLANLSSRGWNDKKEIRTQLSARADAALAEIEEVRVVAVDTSTAFASFSTTATATFGTLTASVSVNSAAVSTLGGYVAASHGVALDVNGYIVGTKLVNGGAGLSSFDVVADKFRFQFPGYNGGLPQDVFAIGTINGVAAVGIRGNLNLDGTFNVKAIAAGAIDVIYLKANSIDSASGVIKALGVDSLSIADNAVTVPVAQILASNFAGNSGTQSYFNFNLSINTAGLTGKTIPVYVNLNAQWVSTASSGVQNATFDLVVDGIAQPALGAAIAGSGLVLVPLSQVANITGTGGNVSVNVQARFNASGLTYMQAGSTIYEVATKR